MLRANVVARGPHLPLWQGLTPHVLLRDFFDADELPLRWSKTGSLSIFLPPKGVPSGKRLHNYGKIHHFEWENPLFL